MASEIELNPEEARRPDIADYLSGKKSIPGSEPIALYYTGHQFGIYNPHIGDGRAILLGEVLNSKGVKWDLHLKGAGRTDFSRQFDGCLVGLGTAVAKENLVGKANTGQLSGQLRLGFGVVEV